MIIWRCAKKKYHAGAAIQEVIPRAGWGDLHHQIALEAARRGVSLNSLIVDALEKETHHTA